MRPAPELRGARMKLQRAEEHLGQFRVEHDRFLNERNPYRMLREADPEPGYYVWRVKIVEHPPLEKWAAIVGECVHSLRSALDHTAYELVRINRPTYEASEFPIIKDKAFWDQAQMRKLPGLDRKVLAQIKWLQPYRRAGEAETLWIVHNLDVIDKHRHLNLVSAAVDRTDWAAIGGKVTDIQPNYGPFEDGTPVVRYKMVKEPDSQMYMNTHFAFDITLGEGTGLAGVSVSALLEHLLVEIGGVVGLFDRFFRP